ncbi:MAG: hypothetical protein RLZZ453_1185 [Chlamydiota bacterium]|jgi:hypothetical protein
MENHREKIHILNRRMPSLRVFIWKVFLRKAKDFNIPMRKFLEISYYRRSLAETFMLADKCLFLLEAVEVFERFAGP